mmetsp:Transcript_20546/g.68861  ORF Transcript_20546/g.68861 Transcript_20546/m.68861 type:complete len:225 (-) Transcript_20546:1533-2207(-)
MYISRKKLVFIEKKIMLKSCSLNIKILIFKSNKRKKKFYNDIYSYLNILYKQFSNMTKNYIEETICDISHNIILIKRLDNEKIVGGICYKLFHSCEILEIVFLCIDQLRKNSGYGSLLISIIKKLIKKKKVKYILTFGDINAYDFFCKSNFKIFNPNFRCTLNSFLKLYRNAILVYNSFNNNQKIRLKDSYINLCFLFQCKFTYLNNYEILNYIYNNHNFVKKN